MARLTETDARTKWCPMARAFYKVAPFGVASINREQDGSPDIGCNCIASDCMFWRWAISEADYGTGYCGAAGRPE